MLSGSNISLNALNRGSLRVAEIELQRSQRVGRQQIRLVVSIKSLGSLNPFLSDPGDFSDFSDFSDYMETRLNFIKGDI